MSVLKQPRRKNLPHAERREQILQSALRAFTRTGYDGTHVEHIVKEAGVGRGTFYLHFKSKHEVFEALVDRMLAIFLASRPLDAEPDVRTVEDAEQLLRRSYTAVLTTFHEHRHLAHLLFDEAAGRGSRFMGQVVQTLIAMPGAQRALASEQVSSRFLKVALSRVKDPTGG